MKIKAKSNFTFASNSSDLFYSFSKWGGGELSKYYITPNDPVVQSLLDNILEGPWYDIRTDEWKIRDYVGYNIHYVSDPKSHGKDEYWQFPRETIRLGKGDCEDFALLYVILLRANGYDSSEVYVVTAMGPLNKKAGHAYAIRKTSIGIWKVVEPQSPAWSAIIYDGVTGWIYDKFGEEWSRFNDKEYIFCHKA